MCPQLQTLPYPEVSEALPHKRLNGEIISTNFVQKHDGHTRNSCPKIVKMS